MLNYRYVVYDTKHLYFTYKLEQLTPLTGNIPFAVARLNKQRGNKTMVSMRLKVNN